VPFKSKYSEAEAAERMAVIIGILKRLYWDLRLPQQEDELLVRTAKSYMLHFDRAKIPTERLVEIYEVAFAERDERAIFSATTMIAAWQNIQNREVERERVRLDRPCNFCGDSGIIKYDNDEPREIPCPYH
jgi:hypothetical protein